MRWQSILEWRTRRQVLWVVPFVVLLLVSLLLSPSRGFLSVYLAGLFLVFLSLGASFLLALERLTQARWLLPVRFPLLRVSSWQFPASALFFLVLVSSVILQPWYEEASRFSPFQQIWYHPALFLLRSAVYLAAWSLFSRRLCRLQDLEGSVGGNRRVASWFMPVFAITFWLCCVDWLLSWIPGWQTTLFAFSRFSSLLLQALSICILLPWYLREQPSSWVNAEGPRVDFGRFLFFTCCLWAYLWYSLHLVIWYAGVPAERAFLTARLESHWSPVFIMVPVLCWLVPFVVLLVPGVKQNQGLMTTLAGGIVLGCWMETYLLIFPGSQDFELVGFVLDLAPSVLMLVLFAGTVAPVSRDHSPRASMKGFL